MSDVGNLPIPRALLLGKCARTRPVLSPDGNHIAFLATHGGARNIWVASANDVAGSLRPLTDDAASVIREIWWSGRGETLIVSKDATGSEETELFAFRITDQRWQRLSPTPTGQSRLVSVSRTHSDEILLETNGRDPQFFDVWRVNILTGAAELLLQNDSFTWVHADTQLRLRLAERRNEDGSVSFLIPGDGKEWQSLISVPPDDETLTRPFRFYEMPDAFGPEDAEIYAMDSRGRDTAALVAWDLRHGTSRLIAEENRADITAAAIDPLTHGSIAWLSEYDRPAIRPTKARASEWGAIIGQLGTSVWITGQSATGRRWIVARQAPERATGYYLFDRESQSLVFLYDERPALNGIALAPMDTHILRARDGLELVCYLTRPASFRSGKLPLVALIHGGPWIRDHYAFDPWIQLLADRGYGVLNVNFRGSRGFGKTFLNAGDREWGGKMLDDVLDAVRWAIDRGIALPDKIAVMGASFGGYSALMALTRAPKLFACGVDIFGVSDLQSFLERMPAHWKALKRMWAQRVGDLDTEEGRALLASRSPLHLAARIASPVLIVQGGADPRVTRQESDQIAFALAARDVEVTYALFPDEGHSFYQPMNELAFFACVEAFLARHLGGRAEAFAEEITRSSIEAPLGAQYIHGLAMALRGKGGG
jgi:dipeptidyl aminopeptidase/acylaminoacyl peptidase